MKATELLRRQHREVSALFDRIEASEDAPERQRLFDELAERLYSHDELERQVFYPACERAFGVTDLLGEALVADGLVEFSLHQEEGEARENESASGDALLFDLAVLKEVLEHHVEEEECELFPTVERTLGAGLLEELGARMAQVEAKNANTKRAPVHPSLRQVMAGSIRTGSNGAARLATKSTRRPPPGTRIIHRRRASA